MARFMVTAMPFSGHVAPVLAVAAALVARGHDVRFYTGSAVAGSCYLRQSATRSA